MQKGVVVTLYEKYGGFATIHSIVQNFYDDVLAEDSLRPYFDRVNMTFLLNHQTEFLSQVLGGPFQFTGKTLREAHQHLYIKKSDFELVAQLLRENLEDFEFEKEDIETVMELIAATLPEIVFESESSSQE